MRVCLHSRLIDIDETIDLFIHFIAKKQKNKKTKKQKTFNYYVKKKRNIMSKERISGKKYYALDSIIIYKL